MNEIEPLLLPADGACNYLGGICRRTLFSLTHREADPLPCVRLGSRVFYDTRDLSAWVDRQKQRMRCSQ
jgi:hypothetical protein